ncbi:MAG: VWA domain-containing protein [Chitinivibrionia bacterium]|nr:VWA domain-containing protein [Chitinivibrionia bacterium]
MEILNPNAFWFLLALPLLALFHLLAPMQRTYRVSSLHLWREFPASGDRRFRWRRFYTHPHFLLQAMAVLLLTAALADPVLTVAGDPSVRSVLIFDTSAGMKTVEREGVRIDLARREALKILERWKEGEIVVLSAGAVPRVLFSGDLRDREDAARKIRELRAGDGPGRILSAVQNGVAWRRGGGEVVLLTDGASPETLRILRDHPEVVVIPVGRTDRNVAITALEFREHPPAVVALLRNTGGSESSLRVEAFRGKKFFGEKNLLLSPGETVPVTFQLPPDSEGGRDPTAEGGEAGVIEVRLQGEDAFSADNRAWVIEPRRERATLLLVTPGNPLLERGLKANPSWEVTVMTAENYERISGIRDSFDVVILDRYPLTSLGSSDHGGRGGVFFLAPPGRTAASSPDGKAIRITDWNGEHPVMRFVEPASLRVRRTTVLTPPLWAEILLEGDYPLIYGEESPRGRTLVMGFEPSDSDFPEGPSFPIFLLNAVRWLQERDRGDQIHAGAVYWRRALPGEKSEEYEVINPDGTAERAAPSKGIFRYGNTERAGVYRVSEIPEGGEMWRFAVNVPPEESVIGPLPFPGKVPAERGRGFEGKSGEEIALWSFAAVLALGAILAEWGLRRKGTKARAPGL